MSSASSVSSELSYGSVNSTAHDAGPKLDLDIDLDEFVIERKTSELLQKPMSAPEKRSFQIFIKDKQGKSSTLEVRPDKTVQSLKKDYQKICGITVAEQRLLYNGKQLNDGHTMRQCNITQGAQLQSTLRLHGG
jgi:ubiquitin-large subunit ribosomal protein L40e